MKAVLVILTLVSQTAMAVTLTAAEKKFFGPNGTALDTGVAGTVKICGELRSSETNRQSLDGLKHGESTVFYELRLDCNGDRSVKGERRWLELPAVVKNPMNSDLSERKGWATRYQNAAEAKGGTGAAPFLCVQAVSAVNPCARTVKTQRTRSGFYRFTSDVSAFQKKFAKP